MIAIKLYSISAYRNNGNIYPYIIVIDFDNKQIHSRITEDLQHAYMNKQVKEWMNRLQQDIQSLENLISTTFPNNGTRLIDMKCSAKDTNFTFL